MGGLSGGLLGKADRGSCKAFSGTGLWAQDTSAVVLRAGGKWQEQEGMSPAHPALSVSSTGSQQINPVSDGA